MEIMTLLRIGNLWMACAATWDQGVIWDHRCHLELCLGPWPCSSHGWDWHMWSHLSPITMKKHRVKPATWVRVGDPEPEYTYIFEWPVLLLNDMRHLGQAAVKGYIWVCSPTAARGCADVHCSFSHQRPYKHPRPGPNCCLGTIPPLEAVVTSRFSCC